MQKILDLVDMQVGFMRHEGSLFVDGAEEITMKANEFLSKVDKDFFQLALLKMDTHFATIYPHNPESQQFPLHCQFNTADWQFAIDINIFAQRNICHKFLLKNQFDMWGQAVGEASLLKNATETDAFASLNHVISSLNFDGSEQGVDRDSFFANYPPEKYEIYLMGVASDYCNRYAMEGYLKRNYKVNILTDLTKGIAVDTEAVCAEPLYKKYRDTQQLNLMLSSDLCP